MRKLKPALFLMMTIAGAGSAQETKVTPLIAKSL
jgi:hypothetical protein